MAYAVTLASSAASEAAKVVPSVLLGIAFIGTQVAKPSAETCTLPLHVASPPRLPVIVAGSISSLNVTAITIAGAIPVAASAGEVEITIGGSTSIAAVVLDASTSAVLELLALASTPGPLLDEPVP